MNKYILFTTVFIVLATASNAQGRGGNPRLAALIAMQDQAALQDSIKALTASTKEEELQLLASYYSAKENAQKRDEIAALIKQRFPNGRTVFNEFRSRIASERDPVANEKNYRELVARFGSRPEFSLDNSRYFVAIAFMGNNRPEKVLEYMNMIQDSSFVPVAFYSAAREAILSRDYKLGETLIRRTYASLKGDTTNGYMDEFSRTMSEILYANGKYQEGFPYAKRVYDKQSKSTSDASLQVKSTYVDYLLQLKKYKEAFPLMEEQLKAGGGTALMKEKFKDAYRAAKGSEAGADVLLKQLDEQLRKKTREEMAKQMINTPAYAFELKDLSGKTVKLSDFKGKVVVLDFWATWCGPCKASFPAMQQAVDMYRNDKDVVFLFVHTMESGDNPTKAAADYISSKKYRFNVLMDLKDPVTQLNPAAVGFHLRGVPTKIIIDKAGNIRFNTVGHSVNGDIFLEEMQSMIELAKNA